MHKLRRAVRYAVLHALRNPIYLLVYSIAYVLPGFVCKAQFFEPADLKTILESGKSLIRFGDGEIYLMNFGSMGYESYSPELRNGFFRIIREYTASSPYVLAVNEGPLLTSNRGLRAINLLNCWLPLKVYFLLYFPKKEWYLDSSVFYYPETIPQHLTPYLMDKHVVIVTKQITIEAITQNQSIPFTNRSYVVTPETGTMSRYKEVLQAIRAAVDEQSDKKSVVLLACGPASKVIAYELALLGIQAVDIGVGAECMYTNLDKSAMVQPPAPYRLNGSH